MVERPILFSGPMVRAILDGRKTQTRRVVSFENSTVLGQRNLALWNQLVWGDLCGREPIRDPGPDPFGHSGYEYLHVPAVHKDDRATATRDHTMMYRVRPIWDVGDRLWVRESLHCDDELGWCYSADDSPITSTDDEAIVWLETRPAHKSNYPSIHMPRWASRITLDVVSVRVERLNEISEADAIAEGSQCAGVPAALTNRGAFAKLWDSINAAKHPWSSNPFVWVVEFRRLEATRA